MKHLISLLILTILAFASCQDSAKKTAFVSDNDSIQKDSIIENGTVQDTSWGDWHIHIKKQANNLKVIADKEEGTRIDTSYFVTMTYKGKKIFDNLEINKMWLNKEAQDVDSLITFGDICMITNTTVYMDFWVTFPDSDFGDFIFATFSRDGSTNRYFYDTHMGDEDGDYELEKFYIFYTHEHNQNPSDKASLQKVANQFCSRLFCKKLEREGSSILYPDTWPIIKRKVVVFSTDDEYYDNTVKKWYRKLYFHSKDKTMDSIKAEFIKNKEYSPLINGIEIYQ